MPTSRAYSDIGRPLRGTALIQPLSAQYVPGGCPGTSINYGGGMAAQCPDGSLASGYPTITCGGSGNYQPQMPSGVMLKWPILSGRNVLFLDAWTWFRKITSSVVVVQLSQGG